MATIRDKIRELSQGRSILIDDTLTVTNSYRLSPGFQRVTVGGDCLSAYSPVVAADAFKIDIARPETGERLVRGFTVRNFDPATLRFDFDVALHPGGAASAWALSVTAGERVPFLGFRRDFAIGDATTRHSIIADASGLPAVAAILAVIPRAHEVRLIAETRYSDDRLLLASALEASSAGAGPLVDVRWITGAPSVGARSPLAVAASEDRIPAEAQVWLAAESSTVRAIRRHVLESCAVPRSQLHATAYWIQGLTSSDRDVHEARVYGDAVAAGLDVMDPEVYDRIEFEDTIGVR